MRSKNALRSRISPGGPGAGVVPATRREARAWSCAAAHGTPDGDVRRARRRRRDVRRYSASAHGGETDCFRGTPHASRSAARDAVGPARFRSRAGAARPKSPTPTWRRRGRREPVTSRNIHVAAAASPRLVFTEDPRRCRGVAATRFHGRSTSRPRRRRDSFPPFASAEDPRRGRGCRRDSSLRNIHVAAATVAATRLRGISTSPRASPRLVSAKDPHPN